MIFFLKKSCKKVWRLKNLLYLCTRNQEGTTLLKATGSGALVQLVRIRACHARGQGFESPTHRTKEDNRKVVFFFCLCTRAMLITSTMCSCDFVCWTQKCPKQVTIPHRSAIIALKNKSIAYGTTHISGVARIFMLLLASLCFKVSSRRLRRSSPLRTAPKKTIERLSSFFCLSSFCYD